MLANTVTMFGEKPGCLSEMELFDCVKWWCRQRLSDAAAADNSPSMTASPSPAGLCTPMKKAPRVPKKRGDKRGSEKKQKKSINETKDRLRVQKEDAELRIQQDAQMKVARQKRREQKKARKV